jgi:hypothetical protein
MTKVEIINLKEVISFVFNERLKMKEQKNPLQEIYKLIMNSSYGKCLQKAHPEKLVFKNQSNIDKFMDKNYNYITDCIRIYNDNEDYKKYIVKMKQVLTNIIITLIVG